MSNCSYPLSSALQIGNSLTDRVILKLTTKSTNDENIFNIVCLFSEKYDIFQFQKHEKPFSL